MPVIFISNTRSRRALAGMAVGMALHCPVSADCPWGHSSRKSAQLGGAQLNSNPVSTIWLRQDWGCPPNGYAAPREEWPCIALGTIRRPRAMARQGRRISTGTEDMKLNSKMLFLPNPCYSLAHSSSTPRKCESAWWLPSVLV